VSFAVGETDAVFVEFEFAAFVFAAFVFVVAPGWQAAPRSARASDAVRIFSACSERMASLLRREKNLEERLCVEQGINERKIAQKRRARNGE
jgi:hypothetical protein